LTVVEKASVFDVPVEVVHALSREDLEKVLIQPGRTFERCAHAVLAHAGILNRGGGFVFSIALRSQLRAKLQQEDPPPPPELEVQWNMEAAKQRDSLGLRTVREDSPGAEKRESPLLEKGASSQVSEKRESPLTEKGVSDLPFPPASDTVPGQTSASQGGSAPDKGDRTARDLKATKSDDAAVPVWLWNDAVREGLEQDPQDRGHMDGDVDHALEVIRNFLLLRKFKLGVTRSYLSYIKEEYPEIGCRPDRPAVEWKDERYWTGREWKVGRYTWHSRGSNLVGRKLYQGWWNSFWGVAKAERFAGHDAIWRASDSTWWDWDSGSAPLYWRWPKEYQVVIRDGLPIWFSGEKPCWRRPQQAERDATTRERVIKKLDKVRKRKYISPGTVWSLTDFFSVPKGLEDIRLVYNGSRSGLNGVLWVPGFPMPTGETILRAIFPHSWMDDTDMGEFFLNFILHAALQELAGVDLSLYRTAEEIAELGDKVMAVCWERWARCAMGLKPSPYQTGQAMLFAEEVIRGLKEDPTNIFRWARVELNLPGSAGYDPAKPWVFKEREDGDPAADFALYVDDNRAVGNSREEARQAGRRVASVCSYLGVQDAARKRRMASQTPGAWAGTVISTDGEGVYVTVSQEKWEKAQAQIKSTLEEMDAGEDWLDHKTLEKRRGFLLYVTRTYPAMVPYLKGIHLTLDGWRKGRDAEGWKMADREARRAYEEGEETGKDEDLNAPKRVKAKPRLRRDLEALTRLFSADAPPKRRIRNKNLIEVYYGFGDASQDGFGFNIQIGDRIVYRFGQWSNEVAEKSSNYRELLNLVVRLEELVDGGTLKECEVFLFTDNSTAESVYYKGNSSSKPLFELVLRLRQLEMCGNCILHVVHVAGTRMQLEGADGSSRGDQTTGVMAGAPILKYVPLHQSAPELEPGLVDWIQSSWDHKRGPLQQLTPEGWFSTAMNQGNYLWTPAPAAADVAGEQMARAIHKHPYSCHMFVAPRLMTARWQRRVGRIADFKITLDVGFKHWGKARHEPLLIFVCLPLSTHSPWKLRGCRFVAQAEGKLRSVSCTREGRIRNLLRQLFIQARRLDAMPESLVRGMLQRPRFKPFPNSSSS
jgi:hypothetical protein